MRYALIDESGRLYDPEDRILVFTALAVKSLTGLDKIVSKARDRIPRKGKEKKKRFSEIKFSLAGDNTRQFILKEIARQKLKIYLLVINKEGRKIKDNPENYALLINNLLKKIIEENPKFEHILIDRHFTFITQRERFNDFVQKRFKRPLFIEHLDSLQNPIITLADFIAGAVRFAYFKKNNQFKDLIRDSISDEKVLSWRELKSGKS